MGYSYKRYDRKDEGVHMKRKYKKNMGKRAVSMSLAIALAMGSLQGGVPWVEPVIVKAADSTVTVDENQIVTTDCMKDSKLLSFIKELVNKSLNRDINTNITMKELINYTGDIDLSSVGGQITTIEGLGYARSAKNIDLSTVSQVTTISKNEFDGCKGLETITLPATIKTIEDFAFRGCEKLKTITLPQGLTSIGQAAFSSCSVLDNITLPDGIAIIGDDAFKACTTLSAIAFPNGTVKLGSGIFEGCRGLKTVTFADDKTNNFTIIPNSCFKSTSIENIVLPDTVTTIEDGAFQLTTGLKNVDFSNCTKLTKISQYAFAGSSVQTIKLPSSLMEIETLAFNSSNLRSIVIPDQVGEISKGVFLGCTNLTTVSIPQNTKVIKDEAFSKCYALNDITIRNAKQSILESIGNEVFQYCYSLRDTKFLKDLPNLKSIGDYAFCFKDPSKVKVTDTLTLDKVLGMEKTEDVYGREYFAYGLKEVILPDSLMQLGAEVFYQCPDLSVVTFGKNLQTIPEKTFYQCGSLQELVLPENLVRIGDSAFAYCSKLKDTVFPEKLTTIGAEAFANCGTASGYGNEVRYNIKYVKPENIYETKPTTNEPEEIDECITLQEDENGNQYFKSLFINKNDQKEEITQQEIESGDYVTVKILGRKKYVEPDKISKRSETGLTDYRSYTMSEDGTKVLSCEHIYMDSNAPRNVYKEGDTTIYIRGGNTGNQFQGTDVSWGLEYVNLPDSVTEIGDGAFMDCYNLEHVKLSDNLKTIPNNLFAISNGELLQKKRWSDGEDFQYQYEGLVSVTLPSKLETIGEGAFKNCYNFNLVNGELPGSLTKISDSAFENCRSLTKVQFPSKLVSIGNNAFKQCCDFSYVLDSNGNLVKDQENIKSDEGLKTVSFDIATALEEIGEGAFYGTPVTSITLPEKVKILNAYLFQKCSYLTSVICSDNTNAIKAKVFSGCSSLASVHIPATTTVSKNVFYEGVNRDVTFTIKKTPELSVAVGHEADLPLNLFIDGQINDNKVTVETIDGGEQIISYTYDTIENINNWDIRKVKVKGEKLGQRTITVSASLAYPVSEEGNVIISPKASFVINVVEKKCEKIEDSVINRRISITDTTGTLLSPKITPADTTQAIEWSNNAEDVTKLVPKVVTKDGKEVLTGEAEVLPKSFGTSKITLKIGEQFLDYFVQVVVPAAKVNLSKEEQELSFYLDSKKSQTLHPSLQYDTSKYTEEQCKDYADRVTYKSSDESIVKVDENGTVTPVGVGNAKITITAEAGKVKTVSNVTVYPTTTKVILTDKDGKALTKKTMTVKAKEPFTVYLKTNPENSVVPITYSFLGAANNPITWTKTNTSQIETEDGKTESKIVSFEFVGNKLGTGTILIAPEDSDDTSLTEQLTVNVVANTTAIVLNPISEMKKEEEAELFESLTSILGRVIKVNQIGTVTTDELVFYSSNENVIAVDAATGKIKAKAKGTATVTVTAIAQDGSSIEEKVTITVTAPVAEELDFATLNEKKTLRVNDTLQLKYQFIPANAEDSITFTSSNPAIATVDEKTGLVKGKKAGVAVITATTAGKQISKKMTITITNPAAKITFSNSQKTLYVGGKYKLAYSVIPNETTDKLTWSSGNTKVAIVDQAGNVTAIGTGSTVVTVKADSGVKASCKITVLKKSAPTAKPAPLVKSVLIKTKSASNTTIYVVKGKKYTLKAVKNPMNASGRLTWISSNKRVAAVNAKTGTITAKKTGTCKITVRSTSGKTKKITVKVVKKAKRAKKVTIQKRVTLKKGKTLRLKVKTTSQTTDTLTWKSSKKSVAKIDAYGYVTAIKAGKATITVRTTSGKKAQCTIVVK